MGEVNEASTDQASLRFDQYRDSGRLQARMSIYSFTVPQMDFLGWVLDHTDWPTGAVVVDVGSGSGQYLVRLGDSNGVRGVGLDLSAGMVAETVAAAGVAGAVGDVRRLPLRTRAVDRVLALHMLYHCADVDAAVAELRRIMRPGGVTLVVTNGDRHGHHALIDEAAGQPLARASSGFTIENGEAVLRRHFDSVTLDAVERELRVPTPEPVVRFVASMRSWYEPVLPDGLAWSRFMANIERLVGQRIERDGEYLAPTHSGVFTCG